MVTIFQSKYNLIVQRETIKNKNFMPQLLPFYFVNQITFALLGLFIITYVISAYILPYFVQLLVTRVYICKL